MSRPVELSPWHTHFCKIRPAHGCKAALRARLPLLTPPTPPPLLPGRADPAPLSPRTTTDQQPGRPRGGRRAGAGRLTGPAADAPRLGVGGGTGGPCLPRPRTPPPPWAPTSGRGDAAQHRAPPCPPTVPSHPRDPSGGGSVLTPPHTHRSAQGIPAGPPPSPPPSPPRGNLPGRSPAERLGPLPPAGPPPPLPRPGGGAGAPSAANCHRAPRRGEDGSRLQGARERAGGSQQPPLTGAAAAAAASTAPPAAAPPPSPADPRP